jgi:hypothetical protein
MNSVYFGCKACRTLVDAGYRWATSTLETSGVVALGGAVDVARVLEHGPYWSPSKEEANDWLTDGLLRARAFLEAHADHAIVFGDVETIEGPEEAAFLDWLDVSATPEVGPRTLTEVLHFTHWVDAVIWVRAQKSAPWWWHDAELTDAVRRRFVELVGRDGVE